ncbi:MAG TPA: hypothetical protein VF731_02420 [Solirubrobacterales bacterium]
MSLLRHPAHSPARRLTIFATLLFATLSLLAGTAQAFGHHHGRGEHLTNPATEEVNKELSACPGQVFSQPFAAFEDDNYYTLVDGSQFNAGPEGWLLWGGAEVVGATRPDGSSGGVLDLPGGAVAVSPPVCVTLQYPSARAWAETVEGGGGLNVGVYYAGARSGPARAEHVGILNSEEAGEWDLSEPFEVKPQIGGDEEGVREVRFIFHNPTRLSDFRIWGLYVDPRMR